MSATDYRNATFEELREKLTRLRRAAYEAWVRFGPGTTRQVAGCCGMDILTFRPRTTELLEAGLLREVPDVDGPTGREGIYRAVTAEEWQEWRDRPAPLRQMQLI